MSRAYVAKSSANASYELAPVIPSHVAACLKSFDNLCALSYNSDHDYGGEVDHSVVLDELGRFRVWAGNIGAHRKGRSSLDYKLRDASHIKVQAQRLLEDLDDSIQRAVEVLRGDRIPWDRLSLKPESDSETSETDSDSDNGVPEDETELHQLIGSIHDAIAHLLRFSVAIRNPAPHDQYMNSSEINTSFFENFDIDHVRNKYPGTPDYLAVTLGKAISRRRAYFKYRESHSQKLSQGINPESPLANPPVRLGREIVLAADAWTESRPQSTIASSLPLGIKESNNFIDLDQDHLSETGMTQTSFATSNAGFQGLKVPPIPKEAHAGDPFPCPFCFMIISVSNKRSWKKHVFNDLRPYTCTFPSCKSPDVLFERRHEWFQHEHQAHRRFWVCTEGCTPEFQSQAEFEAHMKRSHPDLYTSDEWKQLEARCERGMPIDGQVDCILCGRKELSLKDFEKHLGRHQEQLALFALPSTESDEPHNEAESAANTAGSMNQDRSIGPDDERVTESHDLSDDSSQGSDTDHLGERSQAEFAANEVTLTVTGATPVPSILDNAKPEDQKGPTQQISSSEDPDIKTMQAGTHRDLEPSADGSPEQKVETLLQRIRQYEDMLSLDSIQALTDMQELGSIYHDQKKYHEAEVFSRRSFEGMANKLGRDHVLTLGALYHLAMIYRCLGELEVSRDMFQSVTDGYMKTLGAEDQRTIEAIKWQSVIQTDFGNHLEAETPARRAVAAFEKTLGPEHPQTLETTVLLGSICTRLNKFAESEALLKRALRVHKNTSGLDFIYGLEELSALYQKQGKLDEAEPLSKRVIALYEKDYGPQNFHSIFTLFSCAEIHMGQGRLLEARDEFQRVLEAFETNVYPETDLAPSACYKLSCIYDTQGKSVEQEKVLEQAVEYLDDVKSDTIRRNLGMGLMQTLFNAYWARGKFSEATKVKQRAFDQFGHVIQGSEGQEEDSAKLEGRVGR